MTRRELLSLIPVAGALETLQAAQPAFDRIDCHVHMHEISPPVLAGLSASGWRALVVCLCGGIGDEPYDMEALLQKTAKLHRESKGRVAWAAAFDARGWESPDFTGRVTASLGRAFKQGAVGVKIWKNIGMAIRSKKTGEYLKPDNAALMPIYESIQKADRTLLVHVADPAGAFAPRPQAKDAATNGANRPTPSWWQLYGRPGAPNNWWDFDQHPGSPPKEELLLSRDRILARYPKLRVVGVHIGSNEEDLGALARRLETFPNFAVDLAARINVLTRLEAEAARQFLVKYQDRVVYGSDSVVVDEKARDEESWKSMNAAQEREWNYLASSGNVTFGATARGPAREITGLGLSEKVLRKIFYENPKRWFPGIAS